MTEGRLTEPQYVEGLSSYLRAAGAQTSVKTVCVGKDPVAVVKKCIAFSDEATRTGKEYHDCVCLVDVDQHATLVDACTLAKQNSVILLVSNTRFEVWLRWHRSAERGALTSRQLDQAVEELGLMRGKCIAPRFPYDAVDDACATAWLADPGMRPRRVGPNPSSAMPLLVRLMKGDCE